MSTSSGIVGLFDDMSIHIALNGGRMSLAHLIEFSHFVDLYVLEDRVYLSDVVRTMGVALRRRDNFVPWFDDDPTSPLLSLPENDLSDAAYHIGVATLGIYDYAPQSYTFDMDSYRYWLAPVRSAIVDQELSDCQTNDERLHYFSNVLDDQIERALQSLADTSFTLMPSARNLLPFLDKFHQIETPALSLYKELTGAHRRAVEGVLALTRPRTVYLPPLLTLLLSRCNGRDDIPKRLIELRAELSEFRANVASWLRRLDESWSLKQKMEIRSELDACLLVVAQHFGNQRRGVYRELLGSVVDGVEDGNVVKIFTKPAATAIKQIVSTVGPEALAVRRVTGLIDVVDQSLQVFENGILLRNVFGDDIDISQHEITAARRYRDSLNEHYGVGDDIPA